MTAVDNKPTQPGPSGLRRRRSSAASNNPAQVLMEAAKTAEEKVSSALRLLLWNDLPAWRRDNAYILSGYRPDSNSYRKSFASLGQLHNESVNIWSHLLGAAAFAATAGFLHAVIAKRYATASASDVLVFACFLAGAVACLGMSATFHALSNHSPAVNRWGNKLDYSGIVLLIVGSHVPALYYGFFCRPAMMTWALFFICLLGTGCMVVSWMDHFRTPEWRPFRAMMFSGLGLSGIGPMIVGLVLDGYQKLEERMSLSWVAAHGALYLFGALLYATRFPERKYPGKFDIWGNSHQIFHICVLLAAGTHLYGMAKAFDHHHTVMGAQC